MLSYIAKLQQKPKAERKRIAFVWSAGIGGVIFLLWLGSFVVAPHDKTADTAPTDSPFTALKNQIVGSWHLFMGGSQSVEQSPTPPSAAPQEIPAKLEPPVPMQQEQAPALPPPAVTPGTQYNY